MNIAKEIAEKIDEYVKTEKQINILFGELSQWFFANTDMNDYYLDGFGITDEPDGIAQGNGEYCNQHDYGEDSFHGTYYWPIENSSKYVWVSYSG